MMVMGVTEGARGDTEIAAPLVRVVPGAATELVVSGAHPETGCEATVAVEPPSRTHWCSNVRGLR
jgi:hypothetical protein